MIQVSSIVPEIPKLPTTADASRTLRQEQVEPAADFNEDPFKNYRYEDPFLISDPFQDEEAKPAVVKGKRVKAFLVIVSN